jgi:Carboxypeptidase regulatory-like domain
MRGHDLKLRVVIRAIAVSALCCLSYAGIALAGTVSGTVKNGTSGTPAAGVDVILIQLQGGMQPVATTKTDASGHYEFNNPQLGAAPMLVRVVYRGVNYHEPIPPGKTAANVDVYEPTDKPSAFTVPNHAVIVQPRGSEMMVGEEYIISNKTTPPVAFYKKDGSFEFTLPQGAVFDQASAWGSSGMPVVQATIDKGKNQMALAFPFRPGESGVRISYKLPYADNRATLENIAHYPAERLIIAAPPSVQISGAGIVSAGQDQGMAIYTRDNVAANDPVEISVAGQGPVAPPQGAVTAPNAGPADESQNPSVNSRADASNGTDAPTATAIAIPARIDNIKWILVGGFGAIFLLGFAYLMRRPQPATAGAALPSASAAGLAASSASVATAEPIAAIEKDVRGGLDALKDGLFRLELRRQAGTISEDEYAVERARVEKVLHDLVKG